MTTGHVAIAEAARAVHPGGAMDLRTYSRFATIALSATFVFGLSAGIASAAVKSLSTGVGVESRTPHPDYSVLLSFAQAKGPYVADVAIDIRDAKGKTVLQRTSDGPWLFVELPQGTYHVIAKDKSGETTSAAFEAPASGQKWVHLTFLSAILRLRYAPARGISSSKVLISRSGT